MKILYIQIPEIQNNDDVSIDFTIAFIGLKMIMERTNKKWESITKSKHISDVLEKIIVILGPEEIKEK